MTKDQFIVEALGECWHEAGVTWNPNQAYICLKCMVWTKGNPEFSTWSGFGWLWERFQKHERWEEFLKSLVLKIYRWQELINPLFFRDAVAEFFGWEDTK